MSKLNFYEINKEYIQYLKEFESKIPNIDYEKHDKFVCGVVFKINDINYFAPVSSFNKAQRTNFLIYNENDRPISSIRLSYMFPVPSDMLKIKDFSKEEYKYKMLLRLELNYCNKNIESLLNKAKHVYSIGTNKTHPLNKNCCDFKLLENKYIDFKNSFTAKEEIAATKDMQFKTGLNNGFDMNK